MKKFTHIFFIIFSSFTFSQNLVTNPSFETFSSCPNNYGQVSRATGWFPSSNNNNPLYHTDYCNACGTPTFQVPVNTWGNQVASTGAAYMAEVTIAPTIQPNYRENIYTQLISSLVVGNSYFISLNVSHTDNSQYASNNFGVKFSTVPDFPINNISHVYSSNIIIDKQNWVTISGCFVADSAYNYICIGNFFTDANTSTTQICPSCSFPLYGYYVDDISVTPFLTNLSVSNTSICSGESSTLTASGGTSYSWNTGATTSVISVNPNTTTLYTVIVFNGNCSDTATVIVTVSSPPVAAISGDSALCSGDSIFLSATGGDTYLWNTGATTSSISVITSATATYSVIVSMGPCSDSASTTVIVYPAPVANAGTDITINIGDSTSLSASGGISYSWSNGATSSTVTVNPTTTTIYAVIVSDANGCTDVDTVVVYVLTIDCSNIEQDLFIPNVFSPNGNGDNDVLSVFYSKGNSCIKEFQLTIYNRWGQKVFETANITDAWDGTLNGKNLHSAVFVYYCRITSIFGKEIIKKGNITLLR